MGVYLILFSDDGYHSAHTEFVHDGLGRLRKRLEYMAWSCARSLDCANLSYMLPTYF
jgi:hypothetical protein